MLNKIIIMGRLTRDPELRRTQSGTAVTSFTLAVDRDYKGQDGKKETDFIDCVAWRNSAEFVSKYFTKGRMAVVEGSLNMQDWTDKDGAKRRSAKVVVASMYFGDSKQDDGATAPPPAQQNRTTGDGGNWSPQQTSFGGYKAPSSTYGGFVPMPSGFSEISEIDGDLPF